MHWEGVASWVRGSQGACGSGVTSLETVFKTAESFCGFVLCSSWAPTLHLNYSGSHFIRRHTHGSPIYQQLLLLTRLQLRPVSSSLSKTQKQEWSVTWHSCRPSTSGGLTCLTQGMCAWRPWQGSPGDIKWSWFSIFKEFKNNEENDRIFIYVSHRGVICEQRWGKGEIGDISVQL